MPPTPFFHKLHIPLHALWQYWLNHSLRCRCASPIQRTQGSRGYSRDATTAHFPSTFVGGICEGANPDWVLTSPPYKDAIKLVRSALAVCGKGAALKLSLAFFVTMFGPGILARGSPPSLLYFFAGAGVRQWNAYDGRNLGRVVYLETWCLWVRVALVVCKVGFVVAEHRGGVWEQV